jgi:DNA-binding HxlR family transcriptional regulator
MSGRKLSSTNYYNQSFLVEKCSLNELIYLLSKRWMTEVLLGIEEGSNRFTGLKESLEHISDHILANRLKFLEQNELISKSYLPGNPPRTEYALTDKGTELCGLLDGLCKFAETKMHL